MVYFLISYQLKLALQSPPTVQCEDWKHYVACTVDVSVFPVPWFSVLFSMHAGEDILYMGLKINGCMLFL